MGLRTVVTVSVLALVVPHAATAETIKLGWNEPDGVGVMSFRIDSLTLQRGRWRVRAAITNHSTVALRYTRNRFALMIAARPEEDTRYVILRAKQVTPLPVRIRPGTTWRGSFSGRGTPPLASYVRMTLGHFVAKPPPIASHANGLTWLTSHFYRRR